ncbi:ABC transporter ATP-binding protein [Megalodesulfovibrio paquesii]
MTEVIVVEGLHKRFGDVQAVAGVSFAVRQGEIFGFLGPNGAGKTTTINMLTGLARPDAGSIRLDGVDCIRNPRGAQARIGVAPDESNLYPELTGFENLCFCGALYGMRKIRREARARELLAAFGLEKAAWRKFGGYSKGMKRKLTLAAAIMHEPRILFLDEPSTGIDVASARHIRQLIATMRQGGATIFLTTHYIEEAERLCDRIAFLVAGRVVRIDTLAALLRPVQDRHVLRIACATFPPELLPALGAAFPALDCTLQDVGQLRLEAAMPIAVAPLVRFLEEHHIEVLEARRQLPSLEEVFVRITGLEARALAGEQEPKGGKA